MDRVKRIWYLSPMRAVKVQASLRIRAVSPEPLLLAHTSSESRGTFRQKARSLAPLNGWACAVKVCHDGMLEDTNSLDGAHIVFEYFDGTHDTDISLVRNKSNFIPPSERNEALDKFIFTVEDFPKTKTNNKLKPNLIKSESNTIKTLQSDDTIII